MKVIEIKQEEFEEKIENSKGKVLVDCFATWCGPCKMLAEVIEELSNEVKDCDIYKIDMDEADEISEKYEIMSIPTILFFVDGKLKEVLTGFKTKEELENVINSI